MKPPSFKRHRFPADVIRHAVWLYFGFSLSFRDVEELLAQCGIDVSYETIQCWTIKCGPLSTWLSERDSIGVAPFENTQPARLPNTVCSLALSTVASLTVAAVAS